MPLVTVVIPTRGRPDLLERAVGSVVAQTVSNWEAIVVVDGPDPASEAVIRRRADDRVRVIVNPCSLGGAEARNVGARAARGSWIALLDDDDEWLSTKLAEQLRTLHGREREPVVGFTSIIARAPHGDYSWPRRSLGVGEHLSDYLFSRSGPFAGEGAMHTSSLLVPRHLMLQIPLNAELTRFQDTDWVLRMFDAGASFIHCPLPLTIRYMEEARSSIRSTHSADWHHALEWIRQRRALVTPRAYASFLLIRGGQYTAASRDFRGGRTVVREAFVGGRPTPSALGIFAGKWLIPTEARRWLRGKFRRP